MTVVALGVTVILAIFSSTMLLRAIHEADLGELEATKIHILFLAESAIDHAIANLRVNNTADIASTALGDGTYGATISPLGSSRYRITGQGRVGSQQQNLEAVVQQSGGSVFGYAMFGYDQLDMKNGSLTDSYNSSLGNYDPSTAGTNGGIGTNSTATHAVKLSNGAAINGQVVVGPGMSDPTTAVDNTGGIITGSPPIVSASSALAQPAVSTTGLSCGTKLKVDGTTFSWNQASSPYCYQEIVVDNGASISVTGNVVVYVTGKFEVKNSGRVNVVLSGATVTSKPTQLVVQSASTEKVLIDNDAIVVAGIYAPYAKADIKNSAVLYGSIVADEVVEDNSAKIHYDQALKDTGPSGGSAEIRVESWREL